MSPEEIGPEIKAEHAELFEATYQYTFGMISAIANDAFMLMVAGWIIFHGITEDPADPVPWIVCGCLVAVAFGLTASWAKSITCHRIRMIHATRRLDRLTRQDEQ